MKDQKDIIEEIIRRLKSTEEMPYKEGAWESFRDKHLQGTSSSGGGVAKLYYWWSAAAAVLVFVAAGWWFTRDGVQPLSEEPLQVHTEIPQKIERSDRVNDVVVPSTEQPVETIGSGAEEEVISLPHITERTVAGPAPARILAFDVVGERGLDITEVSASDTRLLIQPPAFDFGHSALAQTQHEPGESVNIQYPTVLTHTNNLQQTLGKEMKEQSRNFKLTDRFSLGLVVAPSSTHQRVSFGGGLLFSYQISKNLSVRTGATFHQYEVNTLKDPLQPDFMEVAKTREPEISQGHDLQAGGSMSARQAYSPMIPNVNAVSGFVQTIDLPLEAKYTLYKGFYANAGVSYAAVVNQRRYAHYIENVNASPLVKGLPSSEEEMQSSVTPVTRVMESENDNVTTSGFGGFVNMSVGKEVKVGAKTSVSVEPFVKIPVGNFKHADMNYRNGGVRIITNF